MTRLFEELINPKEWIQLRSKDIVETHRHLYCKFYDTCLNFAAQKSWMGFTCKDCFVRVLDEERKTFQESKESS